MKKLVMIFLGISILLANDHSTIELIRQASCQKDNSLDICYKNLQNYRLDHEDHEIDWDKLIGIYSMLCQKSYAKACFSLGNLYTYNSISEVKTNLKKSAKYFDRACKLGDMRACNNLGVMYKLGMYVKKNYKKAFELFQKACKHGDHEAIDKACSSQQKLAELLKRQDQ